MNEQQENKITIWQVMIIIMAAILTAAASILFIVVLPAAGVIHSVSEGTGELAGEIAGTGAGVILGQQDLAQGFAEGRKIGESATDTTVEVREKIESLGSGVLEVLTAGISIRDVQTQGEDIITGAYYAALYEYNGNIVFSIDLNDVGLDWRSDKVIITVPEPESVISIDERNTAPVAQYQSVLGTILTTPKDGIESALNSRAELLERSAEELKEYDELLKMAEDEALQQVKTLAESVIIDRNIEVRMK